MPVRAKSSEANVGGCGSPTPSRRHMGSCGTSPLKTNMMKVIYLSTLLALGLGVIHCFTAGKRNIKGYPMIFSARILSDDLHRVVVVKAKSSGEKITIDKVDSGLLLDVEDVDGTLKSIMVDMVVLNKAFLVKDDKWSEVLRLNLEPDISGSVRRIQFAINSNKGPQDVSVEVLP